VLLLLGTGSAAVASRPHLAKIELCGTCSKAQLRHRRIHGGVLCCCCCHLRDLICWVGKDVSAVCPLFSMRH
jgi:hypothetical protein